MQSPERVEAKSEQRAAFLERAKRGRSRRRRRRIVPPWTGCGLNQAALGTRVKNPGVAESLLRGSVLHTPSSPAPFRRSVTRSRLARLLDPEPGRKRREHLRDPMLSSRLAASQQRGVSVPFAISPRVRVISLVHSRAQLFSRGENRLQSTDYFESRSRDENFLSSARPGCAILLARRRRRGRRRRRWRVFLLLLVSNAHCVT